MSESNKTSWDQFTEHGANGCLLIIAIMFAIFMPWVMILYVVAGVVWAGLKIAEYRQNQDKKDD